jgi:hypothetical protein
MKKDVSIMSGKRLAEDSIVVQQDRPNQMLESVRETAVMVKASTETLPEACRAECSTLERDVCAAVTRLVRKLTGEQALPQTEH